MKHFYLSEIYTILCICFIFEIYLCIGLSISDIDILIHGLQFLGSLFPNNFCWLLLFQTIRQEKILMLMRLNVMMLLMHLVLSIKGCVGINAESFMSSYNMSCRREWITFFNDINMSCKQMRVRTRSM